MTTPEEQKGVVYDRKEAKAAIKLLTKKFDETEAAFWVLVNEEDE